MAQVPTFLSEDCKSRGIASGFPALMYRSGQDARFRLDEFGSETGRLPILRAVAQVAPAPAEGTEDAELLPVVPAGASSVDRPVRRQSMMSRFKKLSDTERNLAFALRALGQPRTAATRYSLLATLVVCTLLMLLVAVPYAVNERMNDARPVLQTAIRGLIVGIWVYFMLGPTFLVIAPITVRGGFHRRFLLSLPLTLAPAVGVALSPWMGRRSASFRSGCSRLGLVSFSAVFPYPCPSSPPMSTSPLMQALGHLQWRFPSCSSGSSQPTSC